MNLDIDIDTDQTCEVESCTKYTVQPELQHLYDMLTAQHRYVLAYTECRSSGLAFPYTERNIDTHWQSTRYLHLCVPVERSAQWTLVPRQLPEVTEVLDPTLTAWFPQFCRVYILVQVGQALVLSVGSLAQLLLYSYCVQDKDLNRLELDMRIVCPRSPSP